MTLAFFFFFGELHDVSFDGASCNNNYSLEVFYLIDHVENEMGLTCEIFFALLSFKKKVSV